MLNFFKKKQSGVTEIYFGLILKEGEGTGMLFTVDKVQKRLSVLKEKKIIYTDGWERLTEDVDQALYEMEKDAGVHTKKIIFFLYSHLIDQKTKKITKPYLEKIKKITDNLDLKAVGFIEFHEAIAMYLEKKEESPLTSIIIELDKPVITLFIYKGGELFFSESIAKTEDLIADMETIMSKLQGEIILPSRIILYDSVKLMPQSEKIMAHKWDDRLFIQIPRVEIMSQEELSQSLIEAFSAQIFSDVDMEVIPEQKESDLMGFIVGSDIGDVKPPVEARQVVETVETPSSYTPSIKELVKNIKLPTFKLGQRKLLFITSTAVILILLTTLGTSLYFFHSGVIIVYLDSVVEEKEFRVKGHMANSGSDSGISIKQQSKSIEISDSMATTGEKQIGEKAGGTLLIYNKEKNEKILKKGSTLVTSSGIKFLLDGEVKVASASESLTGEGNILTVTGKSKAQVTASEIGSKANLKKGEKLKVEEYSENIVFATVDANFTGGSEKTIKTVSKIDIDTLKKNIDKKAINDRKITVSDIANDKVIKQLTELTVEDEKYDHEIGEEADNISLKSKVKLVFYTFNEDDLKKVIVSSLKKSISSDHEIVSSNLNYSIDGAKKDNDQFTLNLKTTAKIAKKIDKDRLISQLVGISNEDAKSRIRNNQDIKKIEIKIETPLPYLQSRTPFFKNHIVLEVKGI